jgi:hypothetical protein
MRGEGFVHRNAIAIREGQAEMMLGSGIAVIRRQFEIIGGERFVYRNPRAPREHEAETELSFGDALIC